MIEENNYNHVIVSRRRFVEASEEVRLKVIKEDVWVNYCLAEKVLAIVETFLQAPSKIQAPCLLVTGMPGMGKTTLFEKISKKYGIASGAPECVATMTINVKDCRSHNAFRESITEALTSGVYKSHNLPDNDLLLAMRAQRIRALVIDELNDLLLSNRMDLKKDLSHIKWLSGQPCGLAVVGLGTDECEGVLQSDRQLARRFERLELSRWRKDKEFRNFLVSYQSTLPLKFKSSLTSEDAIRYLIKQTNGVLDEVVKIIINAAGWAILDGVESINLEMLKKGVNRPIKLSLDHE